MSCGGRHGWTQALRPHPCPAVAAGIRQRRFTQHFCDPDERRTAEDKRNRVDEPETSEQINDCDAEAKHRNQKYAINQTGDPLLGCVFLWISPNHGAHDQARQAECEQNDRGLVHKIKIRAGR